MNRRNHSYCSSCFSSRTMRLSSTSIGVVVVMVVAAVAEVIVIGEIDPGALLLVEVVPRDNTDI
jgi:hypothetical protein